MPLLENIHDETRHSGKVPARAPRNSQQQTDLIQLRNELKRAVAAEDYEAAARIRDQIKTDRSRSRGRLTRTAPVRTASHDVPAAVATRPRST